MILATVGTQLPFPRLIDGLNALAPRLDEPVVAQIGASVGDWPNIEVHTSLPPDAYGALFSSARVVVAHAGIGTILSARKHGKPLIVMPRRHKLGEHRNDHQMATAKQVEALPGIHIAWDLDDLERLLQEPQLEPAAEVASPRRDALVQRLKGFIDGI